MYGVPVSVYNAVHRYNISLLKLSQYQFLRLNMLSNFYYYLNLCSMKREESHCMANDKKLELR